MYQLYRTSIFKLSVLSSIVLFFTIFYAQKTASFDLFIGLIVDAVSIAFFTIITLWALVFGIKQRKKTGYSFLPFLINIFFLSLIIVLPLNWIRNRISFSMYHKQYEKAAEQVLRIKTSSDSVDHLYQLPNECSFLSDGGQVGVTTDGKHRAVMFFTFRGILGAANGFVKTSPNAPIGSFYDLAISADATVKNLGNDWYYVIVKD